MQSASTIVIQQWDDDRDGNDFLAFERWIRWPSYVQRCRSLSGRDPITEIVLCLPYPQGLCERIEAAWLSVPEPYRLASELTVVPTAVGEIEQQLQLEREIWQTGKLGHFLSLDSIASMSASTPNLTWSGTTPSALSVATLPDWDARQGSDSAENKPPQAQVEDNSHGASAASNAIVLRDDPKPPCHCRFPFNNAVEPDVGALGRPRHWLIDHSVEVEDSQETRSKEEELEEALDDVVFCGWAPEVSQ